MKVFEYGGDSPSLDKAVRKQCKYMVKCRSMNTVSSLVDAFEEDDCFYMIIQEPEGQSLSDVLSEHSENHFEEKVVMAYLRELLKTIGALRTMNLSHGNITLDSVLVRNKSSGDGVRVRLRDLDHISKLSKSA